jgi:hypothetical protein
MKCKKEEMTENKVINLTAEEKSLVLSVLDDMYGDDKIFDTRTKDWVEFKKYLLKDADAGGNEMLIELRKKYKRGKDYSEFSFIVLYDMWMNKSNIFPVPYNPEWDNKGGGGE